MANYRISEQQVLQQQSIEMVPKASEPDLPPERCNLAGHGVNDNQGAFARSRPNGSEHGSEFQISHNPLTSRRVVQEFCEVLGRNSVKKNELSDDQWSAFQEFREGIKRQSFGHNDEKGGTVHGLLVNLPQSADGLDCLRDIQQALLNPVAQIKALRAYEAMAAQKSILKTLTAPAKEGGFNMKQENAEKFLENPQIPFKDDPVKLAEELKQIGKGNADKTQPLKIDVAYLRQNKEIVRDIRRQLLGRQLSAKQFKAIGATDNEIRDLLYGADMKTLQKFGYSIPKFLMPTLREHRENQSLLAQVDDPGFVPGALTDIEETELELDDLMIDDVRNLSREDEVVENSVRGNDHNHEVNENQRPVDDLMDDDDDVVLQGLTHETKGSASEISKHLVDKEIGRNPKLQAELERRPELKQKLYDNPGLLDGFRNRGDASASDSIQVQEDIDDEVFDDGIDDDQDEDLYDNSLIQRETETARITGENEEEHFQIGDPSVTAGQSLEPIQSDRPEGTPEPELRDDNFQDQKNTKSGGQHQTRTNSMRTSGGTTSNGTTSGHLELPPKIVADRSTNQTKAENVHAPEDDDNVRSNQIEVRQSSDSIVSDVSDVFLTKEEIKKHS